MKKNRILLILGSSLLWAVALSSQVSLSKITYYCETNLAKGTQHNGVNTLYFDQTKGLFIHNEFPKEDAYVSANNMTQFIKGDPEQLPVFTDLGEKMIVYKTDYSSQKILFILEEELPTINWNLLNETKQIGSFNCSKAIGTFGGRTYEVWFTPEIPIPLGPYKLSGLPGMILEAQSQDGKVQYKFASYKEGVEGAITLERPQIGESMSWEQFRKHVINSLLRVEALSTSEYTITNNDPPSDWTIEKDKFTIIKDYKKQRSSKN